jgi:hypothetical protein
MEAICALTVGSAKNMGLLVEAGAIPHLVRPLQHGLESVKARPTVFVRNLATCGPTKEKLMRASVRGNSCSFCSPGRGRDRGRAAWAVAIGHNLACV